MSQKRTQASLAATSGSFNASLTACSSVIVRPAFHPAVNDCESSCARAFATRLSTSARYLLTGGSMQSTTPKSLPARSACSCAAAISATPAKALTMRIPWSTLRMSSQKRNDCLYSVFACSSPLVDDRVHLGTTQIAKDEKLRSLSRKRGYRVLELCYDSYSDKKRDQLYEEIRNGLRGI